MEEQFLQELENKMNAYAEKLTQLSQEIAFQEKGFPFSAIRPVSAAEILGKDWQEIVAKHLSSEEIFAHSKKDGMKPYDITLSSVYSEQPCRIKRGRQITLITEAGDAKYNGSHVVLAVKGCNVLIPVVHAGDAKGIYKNTVKLASLNTTYGEFMKLSTEAAQQYRKLVIPPSAEENTHTEHAGEMHELHSEKKKSNPLYIILGIVGFISVAGVIFLVASKEKTESVTV